MHATRGFVLSCVRTMQGNRNYKMYKKCFIHNTVAQWNSLPDLTHIGLQFFILGEGWMAEWLGYWTLNHEIVGSSPAIH